MAIFTREQYDSLVEAIAAGVTNVSYSGKVINYRSIEDMIRVARLMRRDLGLDQGGTLSTNLYYKNRRFL